MQNGTDRGVFITFEGGDGAGKTTHIKFLTSVLKAQGLEVVCVREPGGTSIGEQLRAIVLDPQNPEMAPETELLIYEAARAQIVKEVILPALARGAVVLCDRFTDSTVAYQGFGRGIDIDFIETANAFASLGVTPDKTILVYCSDRETKGDRMDRRDSHDRLELAGDTFHAKVSEGFRHIKQTDPDRIEVIDTSGKHSDTARQIFKAVEDLFPWLTDGSVDMEAVLEELDGAHAHRTA